MKYILFFLGVFVTSYALAHNASSGWSYDGWCCNGMDCAQIPTKSVKVTKQGYVVTLASTDHPMLTKDHVYTIPFASGSIKQSQDEYYHICFYPTEEDVRCFYAPDFGS